MALSNFLVCRQEVASRIALVATCALTRKGADVPNGVSLYEWRQTGDCT